MGNFFANLNEKMQNFMAGRNGADKLARWTLGASIIVLLVNMFLPNVVLSMLSYALLFYCVYRMFSSNVVARRQENEKFEQFLGRFSRGRSGSSGGQGASGKPRGGAGSGGAGASGTSASSDRQKLTFACEKCGQSLSVPKGRGTLKVTCPKCNHQQKVKS